MLKKIIKRLLIVVIGMSLGLEAHAQDTIPTILEQDERSMTHHIRIELRDGQGNYSSIPVAIIKGKKKGPVFTIVSGVHGFEYPPIIATQGLIQEIDPKLLSGTVIIVPLANPNAFYQRTPFLNPKDNLNLNRSFPGDKNGTITERTAHFLTNKIISNSDVFVDIHGGDANEDLLSFVCYYNNESKPNQTQKARKLTESSGFQYVVSYPYTLKDDQPAKYAFKQAVQDGKVGLSIECGKLGNVQEDAVNLIKKGIYNMLAEMKMYPKQKKEKVKVVQLNEQVYIKSKDKGVFYSNYVAGDDIKKGAVIGQVKNEFGEIITEIVAPKSGIILYKIGTPPVNKGETLFCISSYL